MRLRPPSCTIVLRSLLVVAVLAVCSCTGDRQGAERHLTTASEWVLSGSNSEEGSGSGSNSGRGSGGGGNAAEVGSHSAAASGSERGLRSNPLTDGPLASVGDSIARRLGPALADGLDSLGDAVEHAAAATKQAVDKATGSRHRHIRTGGGGGGGSTAEQRRLQQQHRADGARSNSTNAGRAAQVGLTISVLPVFCTNPLLQWMNHVVPVLQLPHCRAA